MKSRDQLSFLHEFIDIMGILDTLYLYILFYIYPLPCKETSLFKMINSESYNKVKQKNLKVEKWAVTIYLVYFPKLSYLILIMRLLFLLKSVHVWIITVGKKIPLGICIIYLLKWKLTGFNLLLPFISQIK